MDRILIVDDDTEICMLLKDFLVKEGFEVYTLSNPEESFNLFKKCEPDLIILDILMPREDGLSVCQKVRAQSHAPIILASAKGSESDKVLGLGMGADDYIQKPFGLHELAARVKALLRRSRYVGEPGGNENADCIRKGDFFVDTKAYVISYRDEPLTLTMKEYRLLLFFILHENHVFDREALYENIWGYDAAGDSRTVMVHIRKLRRKIEEDPDNPRHLLTVWGMGYKFVAEG